MNPANFSATLIKLQNDYFSMKTSLMNCLTLLFFFTAFASADCGSLQVSLPTQVSLSHSSQAVFPVSLSNTGGNDVLVNLLGTCPAGMSCFFTPSSSLTILVGQNTVVNLAVDVNGAVPGNYSIPFELNSGGSSTSCFSSNLSLSITGVNATTNTRASVSIAPAGVRGANPGDSLNYGLLFNNPTGRGYFVHLTSLGDLSGSVAFNYNSLLVEPGEGKSIGVSLAIPAGTPGGTYNTLVHVMAVRDDGIGGFEADFPISVFVNGKKLSLQLLNDSTGGSCFTVKMMNPFELDLTLKNTFGEVSGPFNLSVGGSSIVQQMVSVTPQLAELEPGSTQDVNVVINPPSGTTLDTYYFSLTASYLGFTAIKRDYCFTVSGEPNFELRHDDYPLQAYRGNNPGFKFVLKNNGTLQEDYAIGFIPINGFVFSITPTDSFSLNPGESARFDLDLNTNPTAPLGITNLQLIVNSRRISQAFSIPIQVISKNSTDYSLLFINQSVFTEVRGVTNSETIIVSNKGSMALENTRIVLEGLPSDWYSVDGPKTVYGGESAYFNIVFRVPESSSQSLYNFILSASSGSEGLNLPGVLRLTPQTKEISLDILDSRVSKQADGTDNVYVTLLVTNTGNSVVNDVKPTLQTPGYYIQDVNPKSVSLQPGESRRMVLTLAPQDGKVEDGTVVQVQVEGKQTNPVTAAFTLSSIAPQQTSKLAVIDYHLALLIFVALLLIVFIYRRYKYRG